MKNIVTLTMNPAIDVNTSVDNFVAERKLRCGNPSREPGGGGINVSRAIRKLGGESVSLYTCGGLTGRMFQELLDNENLNHKPIPIKDATRENIIVYEESSTLQYRLCMPGPKLNDNELKSSLDQVFALDPRPDYIVASGSLPPGVAKNFYAQVARVAKQLGSKIIVDTQGEPFQLALEEGLFLVKPNLRELSQLGERLIENEKQIEDMAEKIVQSNKSEVVVVSLGAAGALMVTKKESRYIRSPAVPIRSKVGAGDSMVAGIVLALSRGMTIQDAVYFGVAAGTAAVMTPGTELCRREDTERLFKEMKLNH
ncbi:MAG: 1-phosphofructokinase family hexose kinase [Thermodesulfobacteriales bacterium]|nr:MAG: 1-phosphofructokinase family hexose kinase [Thermodesulfobacteriales bacterium]